MLILLLDGVCSTSRCINNYYTYSWSVLIDGYDYFYFELVVSSFLFIWRLFAVSHLAYLVDRSDKINSEKFIRSSYLFCLSLPMCGYGF